jgi:2-methylcitrate dehydratase PrpD
MRARKGGLVEPTWGLGFDQFGAAAGAGKVLNLDSTAMTDALGLAGYFAPVPSHNKFLLSPQGGGMAKYGPAGWIAQGGVTTAVLASMGYQGDRSVLDGECGFWSMTASKTCDLSKITLGLGSEWNLLRAMYKRWPCCGVFQSPLGALTKLVEQNDLKPDEIHSILVKNEEHGHLPRFLYGEIHHNVDAQTSLEYNIALAAHRVPVSAAWQSEQNLKDPRIRKFMQKITIEPYARAEETRHQELVIERRPYIQRRPCSVQVTARGRVFTETVEYAAWLSSDNPEFRATDEDLVRKFRANAAETLDSNRIGRAVEQIMNLERVSTAGELVEALVP